MKQYITDCMDANTRNTFLHMTPTIFVRVFTKPYFPNITP